MEDVYRIMNVYYDAAERYREVIKKTGVIYNEGEKNASLSEHPPFLAEVTEIDPSSNNTFKSKVSFKSLIGAPGEARLHGLESLESSGSETLP
jgi:hypothetical protein